MRTLDKIYINGRWVPSSGTDTIEVFDSLTEAVMATVPSGVAADVDAAVSAAKSAFGAWSTTPAGYRSRYLGRIADVLDERTEELAALITREAGMPIDLCREIQVQAATYGFRQAAQLAETFDFESTIGNSLILREPIGVVGCITPWNYPLLQIAAKVAFAMAAGCTVVLKPSEIAPVDAFILAEVIEEVGVPAGVFNLVSGYGPIVGEAMAAHPDVDMISSTGSNRAGRLVEKVAAETIKRV